MRIVFASGKGGTGKTILATNLASVLADQDHSVTYLDCDVEAPNGHIFLKPVITSREAVTIPVPEVDEARCTRCGRCGEFCQSYAIVCLGSAVLTFPELCCGCGGCALVCPEKAIREKLKLNEIKGMVPSLTDLPSGCTFHPRCPQKMDLCTRELPGFFQPRPDHRVACRLFGA